MGIMVMTALSVVATITGLTFHHRSPESYKMSRFVSMRKFNIIQYSKLWSLLLTMHSLAFTCVHLHLPEFTCIFSHLLGIDYLIPSWLYSCRLRVEIIFCWNYL